jgi:hypothetical protein
MQVKWTLNRKQVAGLAAYAAILPASMHLSAQVGSWLFLLGVLVSLPFAPLGFIVFWAASSTKISAIAFFATWIFNFLQGWLMLAPYVARMNNEGLEPKSFKRFAIPVLAVAILILVFVGISHAFT